QSVVKIAYTATVARKKTTHDKKLINDAKFALRLYCIQVRLEDFEDVLDYIAEVDNDDKYERVGGSSLGGGCFFGLGNLLTAEVDLDEMMRMAEDGDHRQFDILVSDIYGGKFTSLGLSGDLIAGSFGKCAQKSLADELKKCPEFKKNVMRSLLLMINNSIGQFAFMYAQREKTNRIYFDGFLIRNHAIIMRTISFAVAFWSEGTQQAHFLRHEGYTSAIGAYLNGASLVDPDDAEFGAGCEY
ncbi:putative pantothenate kinase, partial [Teladorsagia circumcincta]